MRNIIVKFDDLEQVIDYAYHNNQNTDEFEDLLYMIDTNIITQFILMIQFHKR